MLVLHIEEPSVPSRRVDLLAPLTAIGARRGYREVCVPLQTASRAVLYVYRDARSHFVDASAENKVLRNGTLVTGFDSCMPGDVFTCGSATFTVEKATPMSRDELARATLLAKGDAAAREVLLDELLAAGHTDEAAYVRGFARWAARGTMSAREDLEKLAAKVEPRFRAQVADVAIERCENGACPKRWSQLTLLPYARERGCRVCNGTVAFCATVEEARVFAAHSRPVAVEPGEHRSHGDLETGIVVG